MKRLEFFAQSGVAMIHVSKSLIQWHQCSEQKRAQFRSHDLTKELAHVSTQIQAKVDTYISINPS